MLLAALCGAAQAQDLQPLVLGGEGVEQGELPSIVLVVYLIPNGKEEAIGCTGTVVAPRVVLTAGHCVEPKNIVVKTENFRVVAGTVNFKSPNRQLLKDIVRTKTYQYREGRFFGDVAVLELSEPIAVPSMRIAARNFWSGPTPAEMAGWGQTYIGQQKATALLHRGGTVIRPQRRCAQEGVEPRLICTSGAPGLRTSACYGDSGGPLLVRQPWDRRLVVAGVLSGGSGCDRRAGVNYYTPSYRFGHWLEKRVVESESTPTPSAPVPPAG